MLICMDILIKMRGDTFTKCFLTQCPSDFSYAKQERKRKVERQTTASICMFYTDWQTERIADFSLDFQNLKSSTKTEVFIATCVVFICLKTCVGFLSLKRSTLTYSLELIKQMLSFNSSHLFPCSRSNCSFDPSHPDPNSTVSYCYKFVVVILHHRNKMSTAHL